jgi:hypothetical protein
MKVLELTRGNVDLLLETENIGVLEDTGILLEMLCGGMYEVYEIIQFALNGAVKN